MQLTQPTFNRQIKLLHAVASLFLMATLSSCMYSQKKAQRLFIQSKEKRYDVIIVPGIPLENNQWNRIMRGRIYWAKYLYDQGIAKNIIFSGNAVYTPYYEGKVMSLYAIKIGIPKEHVYYETQAEHSVENIFYSYRKARSLGFNTIAIASDPFQTKTLRRFAQKRLDPNINVIPFVTDTLRMLEPTMSNPVVDFSEAYKKDFVSLKKREGFFKRLKGTFGKNIKDSLPKK